MQIGFYHNFFLEQFITSWVSNKEFPSQHDAQIRGITGPVLGFIKFLQNNPQLFL